jgi:O-antigen ligase/tetratricopeptide (TPR) repeat protein
MVVLLTILSICSFLFYGVVGQDKTWLLAPVYLFCYGAISTALLKRAWGKGRDGKMPPAALLWVLFLIYGTAMVPHATVPFEAKLVTLFVGGVTGAYLVWGSRLTTFKDNRIILGLMIAVVMLCALYGLVVHFKCPDRVLWAERFAVYEGRLMSTYICPNHFAHLMQMLLPFCLALLFIPQVGILFKVLSAYSLVVFLPTLFLTESRAGWLGSIASVGVVCCLMALRRSRKLFALLVIMIPLSSFLLLFAGWKYSETFHRRMEPVVEFLQGQADEGIGSESRDFRPQTWGDTIDMIMDAPLLGHGPGNYRYAFPEHRKRFRGQRIVTGHPHNEYLELIADYGLVGFVLFAAAWLYGFIWILAKSLKAAETRHAFIGFAFIGALAGTMVHSFFDFQLHVFPNALVFALLAAVAAGPLMRAGNARNPKPGKPRRSPHVPVDGYGPVNGSGQDSARPPAASMRPLWLGKACERFLAVAYLAGTVFCLQIMSSAYIRALGDRDKDQSLSYATDISAQAAKKYKLAIKIDPENWRAYKGLGQLLHQQRYYCLDMEEKIQCADGEIFWFEKAYAHNPKEPELLSSLGKAYLFLGRTQGAVEEGRNESPPADQRSQSAAILNRNQAKGLALLREACTFRKFNDAYWWILGAELRKTGQFEDALEVFRYAGALKSTPSTRKNISWLKQQLDGTITSEIQHSKQKPDNLHQQLEGIGFFELLDQAEPENKR